MRHLPRDLLLLGVVVKHGASVLGASVVTLLVGRRRVVRLVEELDQLPVADAAGVEDDLRRLGVARRARAHGPVRRVLRLAANVAHARVVQALVLKVLAEDVLHAPEATRRKGRPLSTLGDRRCRRAAAGCGLGDGEHG